MMHSLRTRWPLHGVFACAVLLLVLDGAPAGRLGAAGGAVTIASLGTPIVETFNGLNSSGTATWTNDGTIAGWYQARTGNGTTIVASNGFDTAGNLYSFGATGASDRAIGSIGSANTGAGSFYWGVRLRNGTPATITSLTVAYTGEQWRLSGGAYQTIDFSYRIGANLGNALTDFTTGGVVVSQLGFTGPLAGGLATALDGNNSKYRTSLSHTITGLSLPPGQEILLRWADVDHTGADHGLAIDDVSVTANGTVLPTASINDVAVTEGNAGTVTATFTVTVSDSAHSGVTFDIATADGTGAGAATTGDNDYAARSETSQYIAPGATTYSFDIVINSDTNIEEDETFLVNVTNIAGATLADAQGTGSIVNDDLPPPVTGDVVISQVYGGGGNSGATLTHDFVELFNAGETTVSLSGWSVQYLSASGTGTWLTTPLSGSIAPGGYYLVREAQGAGGTTPLPTPDASGAIAMSATAGKVALSTTTTPIVGACPTGLVTDLVGYGAANCFEGAGAAAPTSNTTAALRKRGGCFDSDNNNIDVAIGAPGPRNSSTPTHSCVPVAAEIHDIQGAALATPFNGQFVSTTGIVTALKPNGFFVESPSTAWDADEATSEGLFVFTSALPAVSVGDGVAIQGTANEYFALTQLESTLPGDVVVQSSGNALPSPITLTTSILDANGSPLQLERFESMRMSAASLTSIGPSNDFGETATVITGVGRPMREPGISVLDTVPPDPSSGVPDCCIPRFDGNPERIVIDSDGLAGASPIAVTTAVTFSNVVGPLDFSFGEYKLLPEAPPAVTPNISGVAVPAPAADEFTVAGFNVENFANDDTQRRKAALAIRSLMHSPDVIGLIEILDLASLQALAGQVNADAVAASDPNPQYEAALVPAPVGGTQNVGFLVKTSRVRIDGVAQERASATYLNPVNNQQETLFDRPPLVLRATVDPNGINPRPVIAVVNHLRSFIDSELLTPEGSRVRAKRTAQAEATAGLLQDLQLANPGIAIVSVGDYNAYQFSDGFTDPIGIIKGTPTPDEEIVVDGSPDLVNPNFVNLTDTLPAGERYSFVFQGNAQALDHVIVNGTAFSYAQRYALARGNADFPARPASLFAADSTRPERSSDHDMPMAYFRFPPPSADLAVSVVADASSVLAGGQVSYTVTVTNLGPSPAQNVVVTDQSQVPVTIGTLQAGASAAVTLVASVPCSAADGSTFVESVSAASSTADPNAANNSSSAAVPVSNPAPSINGATASLSELWPANHRMVDVTLSYAVSDACGAQVSLSVASNEAVNGTGDGDTAPDWLVVDATHVRLRAERSGHGSGRVYSITITATDAAGASSHSTVVVSVPVNRRK